MKNLDEVFNLADDADVPQTNALVEVNPAPLAPVDNDPLSSDFDKSRASLHTVLKKGTKAVEDLEQLASLSQSAEHYAALSQMIKTVTDASKVMMGVHTEKAKNRRSGVGKVENHLHVTSASTLEIARMLKGEKEE